MPSLSNTTSMLLTLFFSSFCLLPSPTNASSSNLLQQACTATTVKNWNFTQYVKTLTSIPTIASAKNLQTLALAIVEEGLRNETNILLFIQNELNSKVNMPHARKLALEKCSVGYTNFKMSFKSAFREIAEFNEYLTANYDVKVAEDYANSCVSALSSYHVVDLTLSTANTFGKIFSVSAFVVTQGLYLVLF